MNAIKQRKSFYKFQDVYFAELYLSSGDQVGMICGLYKRVQTISPDELKY
jgi:hypothetical protein